MIGTWYNFFLLANAIIYTVMFIRCVRALIKNHLQRRTRILMWCAMAYTLAMGHDAWTRSFGRIQQHVSGVTANQQNPEYALFAMAVTTAGLLLLAFGLEYSAQHGTVAKESPHNRDEDPKLEGK